MIKCIDKLWNQLATDLKTQYKGFRVLFWADFTIAAILALFGYLEASLLLGILGICFGNTANQKLVLINQQLLKNNQNRIEDKVNVLLGD